MTNDIPFVIPLSAKSIDSLQLYQADLIKYFQDNRGQVLGNIAYTFQHRREHFNYRQYIVCSNIDEAIEQLQSLGSPVKVPAALQNNKPNLAFMFPGQGAQYLNMGLSLYNKNVVFKNTLDKCCEIISQITNVDFKSLIFSEHSKNNQFNIGQTQWAQPALFSISYSLAKHLEFYGIVPNVYIGHSIGEYAAAALSGVFSFEDALKVVVERGKLMQQMPQGSMLTIQKSVNYIRKILPSGLEISVVNSPQSCVVSGLSDKVLEFNKTLEKKKIVSKLLYTSHAFHSSMMDDAALYLERFLLGIKLNKPKMPFISSMTGQFILDTQAVSPKYWGSQLRNAVLFSDGTKTISKNYHNTLYLEVGPGDSLSILIRQQKDQDSEPLISINSMCSAKSHCKSEDQIYHAIAKLWSYGYTIDWGKIFELDHSKNIPVPAYKFSQRSCWISKPKPKIDSGVLVIQPQSKWLYHPTWVRMSTISKLGMVKIAISHKWLIFMDKNNIILNDTVSSLKLCKQQVICVYVDEGITCFNAENNEIRVNPFLENSYQQLFEYLSVSQYEPTFIIHAWSIDVDNDKVIQTNSLSLPDAEQIKRQQFFGFYSLFFLQKYVLNQFSHDINLAVLTNGITQITGNDVIYAEKGTLLGAVKVIPHETPWVKALCLDIGFEKVYNVGKLINLFQNSELFLGEPTYALRMNAFWKEHYEMASIPFKQESIVQNDDVIIITGGLGGIGLAVAKEISLHRKVKFILVGRRSLDINLPKNVQSEEEQSQISNIREIEHNGCNVTTISLDITDDVEVQNLIQLVKTKYGSINGVIHAAGLPPLAMQKKSIADIEIVMSAKILGARHIVNAFKNEKICYFVLMSSLASIMGDVGRIEYCAANSYLDVLSDSIAHSNINFLSINWPGWSDVGMGTRLQMNLSGAKHNTIDTLNMVTSKEGAQIFYNLLSYDLPNQIAVSKFDIRLLKQKLFDTKNLPTMTIANKRQILTDAKTNELEQKIALIFSEILGAKEFSKNDSFFELGGSSLSAVNLVGKLKKIGISIAITDIISNSSVSQLSKINSNVKEDSKAIVPLKINAHAINNVFLIHPVGGTLIMYLELVKKLDTRYNYYGIQNVNIENKILIEVETFEELATLYIHEIQKIQAHGPYILMGASLGGTLAYEMARQLLNLGENVSFVAMFDSWAVFADDNHDPVLFHEYMYLQLKQELNKFSKEPYHANDLDVDLSLNNIISARWELMKLLLNYSVRTNDLKLHLFKAQALDGFHNKNENRNDNGWQIYNKSNVEVTMVEGDHITILEYPGIERIIEKLNILLCITPMGSNSKHKRLGNTTVTSAAH